MPLAITTSCPLLTIVPSGISLTPLLVKSTEVGVVVGATDVVGSAAVETVVVDVVGVTRFGLPGSIGCGVVTSPLLAVFVTVPSLEILVVVPVLVVTLVDPSALVVTSTGVVVS